MKNLAILMVVITMASLADAEMILKIVDNGDGTVGIWSSGYNLDDNMYFALTTASPPYPHGGYVTPTAPAGTFIVDDPVNNMALPLPPGENGVGGYIGDIMRIPKPAGIYINGIQTAFCSGTTIKLYNFNMFEPWPIDSITFLDAPCCIGSSAPEYADWVEWGKPDCWCYARQCRGDINGKKTLVYWVQLLDLQLLTAAYNKPDAQLALIPGGICSDVNHKKTLPYRVQLLDLQELAKYYNKVETLVPKCDQEPITTGPYNYFVEPP